MTNGWVYPDLQNGFVEAVRLRPDDDQTTIFTLPEGFRAAPCPCGDPGDCQECK